MTAEPQPLTEQELGELRYGWRVGAPIEDTTQARIDVWRLLATLAAAQRELAENEAELEEWSTTAAVAERKAKDLASELAEAKRQYALGVEVHETIVADARRELAEEQRRREESEAAWTACCVHGAVVLLEPDTLTSATPEEMHKTIDYAHIRWQTAQREIARLREALDKIASRPCTDGVCATCAARKALAACSPAPKPEEK
jgi:beta-galactosidase beta subunit